MQVSTEKLGLPTNALLPNATQRRRVFGRAIEQIDQFFERLPDLPVAPDVNAGSIDQYLSAFTFERPMDLEQLVGDVGQRLQQWGLHTPHPRYFGLFNPASGLPGMVADLLVAGFNPQAGAWHHNPVGVQIEAHLIRYFCARFGLPTAAFGHFTSGGSEANFSAVLVALSRQFSSFARSGVRGLSAQPLLYCSTEFHHSFEKIAHQCGLGRDAVRLVPVTDRHVMDVAQLKVAIAADRREGHLPFLINATAGTTNAGLVEPLSEIGRVASAEGLHFHVDAAWGGGAILSSTHRSSLKGIEEADTITFDPHKLLSVPMGAGMVLVRNPAWLTKAFGLKTDYVPESGTEHFDGYRNSLQFSRRLIGLKLFMSLAALGQENYQQIIDRQFALAKRLAKKLKQAGFDVKHGASLGVVCALPPASWQCRDMVDLDALVQRVIASGQAWISTTRLGGEPVLRTCVTSHLTQAQDVDQLVDAIVAAR